MSRFYDFLTILFRLLILFWGTYHQETEDAAIFIDEERFDLYKKLRYNDINVA